MRTLSVHARVIVMSSLLAAWTVLGLACSAEDENPATTRARTTDSGVDGAAATGEGGGGPTGAPICATYGGYDNVKTIATSIINDAKADCRIGKRLTDAQTQQQEHFNDCWAIFVGSNFTCPGVAFSFTDSVDSKGKKCNTQLPGVAFTDLDFTVFVQDTLATLKAKGLSEGDVKAVAPAFEGARIKAVADPSKTKHAECLPNCAQGGEACIRIIDAGTDVKDSGNPNDAANDADGT